MNEHLDREPEHELEDMRERSEHLDEDIDAARKDWESKKQDPGVPGAAPEPEADESS